MIRELSALAVAAVVGLVGVAPQYLPARPTAELSQLQLPGPGQGLPPLPGPNMGPPPLPGPGLGPSPLGPGLPLLPPGAGLGQPPSAAPGLGLPGLPGLGSGLLPGFSGGLGGSANPSEANVAYGSDPKQRLDLYRPDGASAAPMVLFIHGGGWSIGDKAQFGWVGEQLARQGLLVAVANYRLSPAVRHPAHAQDVARALAWFHRNGATYGGDTSRLYLMGHSAGAHLSSLVALDPTYLASEGINAGAIRSVVGVAGAGYDLDARYASMPLAMLFFTAFGTDTSRWANAAPVRYVQPYAPPFLLVHGLNDTEAPVSTTQTFAAALQREGVPTQLNLLPGQDHLSVLGAALPSVRAFIQ